MKAELLALLAQKENSMTDTPTLDPNVQALVTAVQSLIANQSQPVAAVVDPVIKTAVADLEAQLGALKSAIGAVESGATSGICAILGSKAISYVVDAFAVLGAMSAVAMAIHFIG